jgi:hypothetical protein
MSRQYAFGEPGEVVTAAVGNPLENPSCMGKARPVVLVRREGALWHVMGLTTKSHYANGSPRTAVPNPAAVGLHSRGYLWGERLTRVSVLDIDGHIGWVDRELADLITVQASLSPSDAPRLMGATLEPSR